MVAELTARPAAPVAFRRPRLVRAAAPRPIPAELVRETIDGIDFYYRGFRRVMNKTAPIESIMSDSGLQSFLKVALYEILRAGLDLKKYRLFTGELGYHESLHNNMGLDVTLYDRAVLTPAKLTTKFVDLPPLFLVEIDVNVELPDPESDLFQEYVVRKVRRLFALGTRKVVWIFTASRNVCVAEPGKPWQFHEWDEEIELWDGVRMNLAQYLKDEGFNLDITFGR